MVSCKNGIISDSPSEMQLVIHYVQQALEDFIGSNLYGR